MVTFNTAEAAVRARAGHFDKKDVLWSTKDGWIIGSLFAEVFWNGEWANAEPFDILKGVVAWQYRSDCNCDKCKEERQQMATGGKTTYGDGSVAGPKEVTTKTVVINTFSSEKPAITAETAEERNNRIWEAIRGASGG